jgi:23S rRNA pseudouridine1911/1915/1917 synthase
MEQDIIEPEEHNHEYSDSLTDEFYDYRIIEVDAKQSPLRIDKFLMDRIGEVSRNRVQNAIKTGSVLVNEQEIKPNFKIKPGQ